MSPEDKSKAEYGDKGQAERLLHAKRYNVNFKSNWQINVRNYK